MAAAEFFGSKVPDRSAKFLAAAAEIAVVEDYHAGSTKKLDRGDVIAKIPRKGWQPIAPADAEMVTSETLILEEARADARHWAVVPGPIPVWVIPVDPRFLSIRYESGAA